MHREKYPSIKKIIQMISKSTPSQKQDLAELHFEIKYAKLKSPITQQYKTFLAQSKKQIFLLYTQQGYHKQYKIHSDASKADYVSIFQNAGKRTEKIKKIVLLDIKVNRQEKLVWEIGKDKWNFVCKEQYFTKLFNVLVDGKEFRVGYSNVKGQGQRKTKIGKEQLEGIVNMVKKCTCLRFKERLQADINPYYYIVMSKIVQIDENSSELQNYQKQLMAVFQKSSVKQTNQYVLQHLEKPNAPYKYEIQLQLNVTGVKYILECKNKGQFRDINRFVGDTILQFRSLCEQKQTDIEQLTKKIEQIAIS